MSQRIFWTLRKPWYIFTRWFGGLFFQDSGYLQGYEIITVVGNPNLNLYLSLAVTGWGLHVTYIIYNIFIRVIDIYNVYICIYIFIYKYIYIYLNIYTYILRKSSLPRFCCVTFAECELGEPRFKASFMSRFCLPSVWWSLFGVPGAFGKMTAQNKRCWLTSFELLSFLGDTYI